ncbi:MAG: hypothetical protein LWW92_11470 [Rhodocyclales bacterium]|nr:hypothetical protein [Rhodocyclales bacterium]
MHKFTRKRLLLWAAAVALVLGLAVPALAVYNGARTAAASGAAFAEVALPGDANARTTVLALSATANNANGAVSVYFPTASTTVDASSTGTTLNVASTSGYVVGSSLVLQTPSGGVVERYVTAVSSGVSLTLDSSIPSGYGDVGASVGRVPTSADATIKVGSATVSLSNEQGVIVGPRGSPMVLSLGGASVTSAAINYATWGFRP